MPRYLHKNHRLIWHHTIYTKPKSDTLYIWYSQLHDCVFKCAQSDLTIIILIIYAFSQFIVSLNLSFLLINLFLLSAADFTVDCPSLEDPMNGMVTVDDVSVASLANYSCDFGYVVEGDSARECLPGGIWSSDAPTCERKLIQCPPLQFSLYMLLL